MQLQIEGFEEAYKVISDHLKPTPLVFNEWLSKKYNCRIHLKLENLQPVGSFKLRGALNMISNLSEADRIKGVLAVSAGNHAQGVAWAASKFDIRSTIIMPKPSPLVKIANTESLGAKVILEGENVDESFEFATKYLQEHDYTFVHPFNNENVIYGQGSIAYELKEQIDNVDYIFGSIGGGGLMTGVGSVMKRLFPKCRNVGSQSSGAASMIKSLQTGVLTEVASVETFADGIKVKKPDFKMYELLDQVIDEAIHVDDNNVALSVLELMERARIISEGAGAINLAAFDILYQKNPKRFENKDVVLIICGGNIDINLVDRIIDNGLIESRRKVKVSILLQDNPGALHELTGLFTSTGANVLQVDHKRDASFLKLNQSIVEATFECKDTKHADLMIKKISESFQIL